MRRLFHIHGQEHDALMHDLVVLHIVQQRGGDSVRVPRHEHRGTGNARDHFVGQVAEKVFDRDALRGQPLGQHMPSRSPRRHQREDDDGDHEREPAAFADLDHIRCEEREIDEEEWRCNRDDRDDAPAPSFLFDHR